MSSFNRLMLIGNLVADPEKKEVNGRQLITARLAVNRDFKDKDGNKQTDFFSVNIWGQTAERFAKFNFGKGDSVFLEGSMENRSWTDQSGSKRTSSEMNCRDFHLIGSRNGNSSEAPGTMVPAVEEAEDTGDPFAVDID